MLPLMSSIFIVLSIIYSCMAFKSLCVRMDAGNAGSILRSCPRCPGSRHVDLRPCPSSWKRVVDLRPARCSYTASTRYTSCTMWSIRENAFQPLVLGVVRPSSCNRDCAARPGFGRTRTVEEPILHSRSMCVNTIEGN